MNNTSKDLHRLSILERFGSKSMMRNQHTLWKTVAVSLTVALFGYLGTVGCSSESTKRQTPSFEHTWESLQQYECPTWFRDAKFGIYAHWGPYCVPAFPTTTDWYSVDKRPRRDVVAEMEKAVRAHGLKFITSFHHHWKWGWYATPTSTTHRNMYRTHQFPSIFPSETV